MRNRYTRMMAKFSLSDEAKENFLSALEGKSKGRSYVPHIAAAAAVFLLVAIALLLPRHNVAPIVSAEDEPEHPIVINEHCAQEKSSYDVVVQLKQHKTSEFSDSLQADMASGKVERAFDSRAEVEKYLGFSLISAPDLESAELVSDLAQSYENNFEIIRSQYKFAPEARYIVTGVNTRGEMSARPEIIKISIHRVVRNTECYIDAIILTEYASLNGVTIAVLGENYPALSGMHHEKWFDENGDYQVETTHFKSAMKDFTTSEYKMPNGCTATIVTSTGICPICLTDKCNGNKEYNGHFVSDGILYSILPFAISDPAQSFPMNDYDMLSVLKSVLQLFE